MTDKIGYQNLKQRQNKRKAVAEEINKKKHIVFKTEFCISADAQRL